MHKLIVGTSLFGAILILLAVPVLRAETPCPPPQLAPPATSTSPPCTYSYTPGARLKDYVRRTVGPGALLITGAVAGIEQAQDSPAAWEQGAEGYGRRFGSNMGKRSVSNTVQLGVEAMLGEDSRFFPSQRVGTWPRIKDAVVHSLIVPARNGRSEPAVGRMVGPLAARLVSRTWQPEGHRGIGAAFYNGGISFGMYVGVNVFREVSRGMKKHLPF